jgi:transposase
MQIEHPVCCGIDVHKDMLTACLRRVDTNGQVSKEGREFATTYPSLLALSDWLVDQYCPVVAMGQCTATSQSLRARNSP